MAQEDAGDVPSLQSQSQPPPQRGTLLRRAHELLETLGQPAAEDALVQHLLASMATPANRGCGLRCCGRR